MLPASGARVTTRGRTVEGGPIVIDLGCLGVNTKGLARILTALTPRLVALGPGRHRAVCSPAALPKLGLTTRGGGQSG